MSLRGLERQLDNVVGDSKGQEEIKQSMSPLPWCLMVCEASEAGEKSHITQVMFWPFTCL